MATETAIAWTDHTFNPWIGCTRVSAECDNCYAWGLSHFRGWTKWGRGEPRHVTKTGRDPLKWNRQAQQARIRHRVFCASLADVFDAEVPDRERDTLWGLIRDTPWLDWQLLTKRPNLIRRMLPTDLVGAPNIWLGTTVGHQASTWRIAKLVETDAVVHFLSIEPLLGPIPNLPLAGIDWVILGGESGAAICSTPGELDHRRLVYETPDGWKPKPIGETWVREIRDQCVRAGVALFFKQWGGPRPKSGGRTLDGRTWDEMPDTRGRSVPSATELLE